MKIRKIRSNLHLQPRNLVCKRQKKNNRTVLNVKREKPDKLITYTVRQRRPLSPVLFQLHDTPSGGNLPFARLAFPVECSSVDSGREYDVFISFRGEDTRENFTSHLYDAMRRAGIDAFIDNELEKGEEMGPSLLDVIARSKIAVVVFSKNYATSTWCLSELVKIVECRKRGQVVLPIFYHVEPKDVRRQIGNYRSAFDKHVERVHEGSVRAEEVRTWRDALKYVANLSGFCSDEIRPESELVQKVVDCILQKLQSPSSTDGQLHDHVLLVPSVDLCDVEQQACDLAVKKVASLDEKTNTRSIREAKLRPFAYFEHNVVGEAENPDIFGSEEPPY